MANFGLTLLEAKRTTLAEFDVYAKSYAIRQVNEMNRLHQQAWLNAQVQATNKKGKPVYKRFDKFFDYEKAYERALHPKNNNQRKISMAEKNRSLQEFLKKGGN